MPSTARERLAILLAAQDELSSSVQLRAKPPTDLHLEVEGIGRLDLPVPAAQARQLCKLGRPARFGRGEETIIDPTVRDTWEIPRELVRVEWLGGSGLAPELEAVRLELGLPEQCRLTADLHSLLVYEKGQFFLPHQDSEKDDAMIATLVVTLPSAHAGGELVVHHLGEATTYKGSKTQISLVAFYADCRHEVRPVASGHRIALTYNLLLHGDPANRVPDGATVAEAARYLGEHFTTPMKHPYRDTTSDPPCRLAFLLDHEYSERGLSWTRLKGNDAHRTALLRAAADAADCETVLALTEIQETWDAYETDADDGYGRSRRGYQRWHDDDDEEYDEDDWDDDEQRGADASDDSRYEVNSLIDSSIKLTTWTDPSGSSAEDISLSLSDAEVCAATPSSDLKPYSSEYEGYMGNWGNTLDRWYRRAAVVVSPRNLSFANRAEASPSWALDALSARAAEGGPAAARDAAATLTPFWDAAVRRQQRPGVLLVKALPAAVAVDDAEAASMLLRPFAIEDLRPRHMASLAELAGRYGERWTDELLRGWFTSRTAWVSVQGPSRPLWLISLPALCDAVPAGSDAGTSTAHQLLEQAWASLVALINSAATSPSTSQRSQQFGALGEPLAAVMTAAASLHAADLRDSIVGYCVEHGEEMGSCVISALRVAASSPTAAGRNDAFAQLAADQVSRRRARLAQPTRAEDDWAIQPPDGCACDLCGTLASFLADPARRVYEWPLATDGRAHVHSRIDRSDLPVTHQTRRQGRPYTLVLTKTAKLFERETQQREQNQADLDWLLEHGNPE